MRGREWPLILFTIAAQLSVGTLVLLWALTPTLRPGSDRFIGLMLLSVVAVLGLGALLATLHLGNSANAWRALSNWQSSWLSRETLFGGVFGGLATLFTVLHWLGLSTGAVWLGLGGLTALAGLALVFSMSRLYMLRTVPAWNTAATVTYFVTTAFLLGSLTVGATLAMAFPAVRVAGPARWLGSLALLAVCVQLSTAVSARRLRGELRQVLVWRLVLLSAVGIFVLFAFQIIRLPGIAIVALGLALLSEIAGRYLFYQSRVRTGL
jgi:DMSO reductase anchor subunit